MATNYSTDEEEDDSQNLVTCDNCLEYEGHILNPRTLPCQHIFCTPCLEGQQRNPGKAFCAHKDCLRQHQVTIDALPSALGDLKMCCDTCATKKGEKFMTAMTYCVQCNMKYCYDHQKAHNELNTHTMMGVKKYLESSFAHELRYCDTHKQEVYCIGCSECSQIFCAECVNSLCACRDGANHKFVSLKKLADDIKSILEPLKIKVEEKFDEISAVIKETTIKLSEWDIETDEGVRLIHRTRDEQLDHIRENYAKLEEDYMTSRESSKEEISQYLAKKAGVIQAEHLTQLKKLRTDMTYRHPVDLVSEGAEMQKKIAKLLLDEFPKLVLQDRVKPVRKASINREIEMELIHTDGDGNVIHPPMTIPTWLQLVGQITVGEDSHTVCRYKGFTYVGLGGGGIDRIDDRRNVTSHFIRALNNIISIRSHNDRLYVLVCGRPYELCVYNLSGQQIASWKHTDTTAYYSLGFHKYLGNKISVIGNNLAVADVTNQRVTLYTLNGDIVKHIPCRLISNDILAMCESGDECVIISDYASKTVFRLNLASGKVEWKCKHPASPLGVVCYGREYVLVTTRSEKSKVWMLNVESGELVCELADRINTYIETGIYDLDIDGDMLIMPRCAEKSVNYYRLLV